MIEIIPAIDLIDGKCVRLSRGDYNQKIIYNENPLEVAKMFEGHGIKRLHLVDLDGAKAKHIVNNQILEDISNKTSLVIDYGGGIKSDEDIKIVMESGAQMATIGSIAVTDPDLFSKWLNEYSPERIILGADVKNYKIAIGGWLETTDINLDNFLTEYSKKGVKQVLCTDISKDGMLEGTSMEMYEEIHADFPYIYLIASGGVTTMDEVEQLNNRGIEAAIIGKAIYEGHIKMKDLETFISSNK